MPTPFDPRPAGLPRPLRVLRGHGPQARLGDYLVLQRASGPGAPWEVRGVLLRVAREFPPGQPFPGATGVGVVVQEDPLAAPGGVSAGTSFLLARGDHVLRVAPGWTAALAERVEAARAEAGCPA